MSIRTLKPQLPPCWRHRIALPLAGLLTFLLLSPAQAQDGYRTWTDHEGREITAKLISQNADSATLRSDNGKMRRIPKEEFSSSDRQYLRGLMDNQPREEQQNPRETEEQAGAPGADPSSAGTTTPSPGGQPGKDWEDEVQQVALEVGGDTQPPSGPEPVNETAEQPRPEPQPDQTTPSPEQESPSQTPPPHPKQTSPEEPAPEASDYAALTGTGVAETTMNVEPQPNDAAGTDSDGSTVIDVPEQIPYKTVDEWDLPNKDGGGRRIIISPKYADAESLRQLGRQLMTSTEEEVYTDIEIFTSAEAAELATENTRQLSLEDRNAFQRHYVAHYHKNVAQNLIQYELFPARPGAEEIVDLN